MAGQNSARRRAPEPANDRLAALRARLDGIDEQLLDIVRERLECCTRIAEVKRSGRVPMMQPHRIDIVQQRAAAYAGAHGIEPGFLRRLYELVIAETCRIEELVIGGGEHETTTPDEPRRVAARAREAGGEAACGRS